MNGGTELRESSSLQTSFLAADMGSHGTLTSQDSDRAHFEDFVQQIYGGPTTVQEWERTFEEVAGTTDCGYIDCSAAETHSSTEQVCAVCRWRGLPETHLTSVQETEAGNPTNRCIKIVNKCTQDQFPAALL